MEQIIILYFPAAIGGTIKLVPKSAESDRKNSYSPQRKDFRRTEVSVDLCDLSGRPFFIYAVGFTAVTIAFFD